MKFLACFLVAVGVGELVGQDALQPLVVTATRAGVGGEAPYTTEVLGADFLRESARRTLPEALQYTPGVLVQKTAHGHGSPFIRGFTGRQNLLLVDGVRVNNSTFRSGPVQYWNTIDSQSLERIEVIKSQGSVLYGSDAIGGTVNALTRGSRFQSEPAGKEFVGGAAAYQFRGNGRDSHIGRLEGEFGVGGKFGVLLGVSAKEFGDIRDSAVGLMRGTGYPERDMDLRLDWAVAPEAVVTFAHYAVGQDDISRWHRTSNNPGWSHGGHVAAPGTWTANDYDQSRSLTYLRFAGSSQAASAAIDRWAATVSLQRTRENEFQNRLGDPAPGSRPIREALMKVETLGIDLMLESDIGPGALVYGLDFYQDAVDSAGYQTNLANTNRRESLPVADDSSYDLLGLYAQYVWKPVERLEVTGGLRHTRAAATLGRYYDSSNTVQRNRSESWDATVGVLRGVWQLQPGWSVFGGAAQAFRAPNLDDLSGNLTAQSSTTALGSADVQPEEYVTYEVGVRRSLEDLSAALSVFYTDAQDLIVGVPVTSGSSTTVATNAAQGYVYGVELEAAWQLHPRWLLSGFGAWQAGRTEAPGYVGGPVVDKQNLRQLPLSGSLALRWTNAAERFWVEGRVLAAAEEDRINAGDQVRDNQRIPTGGTPGYVVASLYAGLRASEQVEINCGVENLTDEDYRIHGSGQNEPGTNVVLGMRVTW